MRNYYHYCSKGLEHEILFKDIAEFIAGVNRVAVCFLISAMAGHPVKILSFCLMDNHFHFILFGEEADCTAFIDRYKKLTLMWISRYRGAPLADEIILGHWFIPRDRVHEKIVYLHRNPVAAGYRQLPYFYRWSSASLLFSARPDIIESMTKAGALSAVKKAKLVSSRVEIPDNWLFDRDGMVWPGCFVDVQAAESQYSSLGSYMFEMNNGNIDKECEKEVLQGSIMLPDGDVLNKAETIAYNLFGAKSINECGQAERICVATMLKKEMGCNVKQLARVIRLKPYDIKFIV